MKKGVASLLPWAMAWLALIVGRADAWELRAPEPLLFPVSEGDKLGFINVAGEVVIPLQFDAMGHGDPRTEVYFREDRANVQIGGKHGFIDAQGHVAIAPVYAETRPFSEGLAAVRPEEKGPWQYVDRDGAVAVAGPFGYAMAFGGGVAFVEEAGGGEKWGLIDRAGRFIVPPRFGSYGDFDAEGYARVTVNKHPEWINRQGFTVLGPVIANMGDFHDGLAVAAVGGKRDHAMGDKDYDEHHRPLRWGYADRAGTFRIPARFDGAQIFHDGLAVVQKQGRYGGVDTTGREVVPLRWDNAFTFSEGLLPVARNGLWGFVDRTGKVVIEPRFDEARPFAGGLTQVMAGDEMGYLDRTGRVIWGLREFAAWGTVREIRYGRFPGLHDGAPSDRLVFRRDGTAEYAAENSFPNKRLPRNRPGFGKWVGRVEVNDFRRLARLLHAEKFFDLNKWYSWGLDGPSVKTTAARDDAEDKTVEHGTGAGPLPVWAVDRAIEAVAADIAWTKMPAEAGKPENGKSHPLRRR